MADISDARFSALYEPSLQSSRPWLVPLREEMKRAAGEEAARYWPPFDEELPPYYNYRIEHVLQVERDAVRIHAVERGDLDVILAAVWAHDRFQPQFCGERHAERAAAWAKDFLRFARFPTGKIELVCGAISMHARAAMDIPEAMHEARVLWDADRLARLGPADMMSFMLCHTSEDFLAGLADNARFQAGAVTVREFAELMLERRPQSMRAGMFYFNVSRQLARERINAAQAFLACLEDQLSEMRAP